MKKEQERRNFVHTLEVLFASAMAERDVAVPSATPNRSLWRKRCYALASAGAAIVILVPAAVWLSAPVDPRKAGHASDQQLAMAGQPAAEFKTRKVQVQRFSESPAERDDAGNAPRNVRAISNAPGEPAAAVASVPSPPPPAAANLSGLMGNAAPPPVAQAPTQPQPAPVVAQPVPPVKVASSTPAANERPASEAAVREAALSRTVVPKVKQAAAAAATSAPGGGGFVAVLASKKSRIDALKAFADLQQKYADVLGAKAPDVQEADLGDKGIFYRVVVGPPGSRKSANDLCTRLKVAGHSGCWVAAY